MSRRVGVLRRGVLGLVGIGVALAALVGVGSAAQVPFTSDLRIFKADNPDPVHVGEALTYSIVVENLGPLPATGVTVTDFLPDGVDFVSAKASSGGCKEAGHKVTCELGGIGRGISYGVDYGAPETVTIVVVPRRAGTITNRALVKGDQRDAVASNDEAITTTLVVAPESCVGAVATLSGTPGVDVLTGTVRRDVIAGLGGNDTIRSLGGDDLICAGAGRDFVVGGPGPDKIFGEAGRDRAFGGRGQDRLFGGAGFDHCRGGSGDDRIRGCER